MDLLGTDELGRMRWRGTGFDPSPGGMTWITENDLRRAVKLYEKWLIENDPPVVWLGERGSLH